MCLAIPGQVKSITEGEETLAKVEVARVRRTVNVDLVWDGGLEIGDWVLIHVGFAMSKISAAEAEEQLQLLDTLGETQAALEEVEGYGAAQDPYDPLGENPFAEEAAGPEASPHEAPGKAAQDEAKTDTDSQRAL